MLSSLGLLAEGMLRVYQLAVVVDDPLRSHRLTALCGAMLIYHDHAFCARLPAAEAPAPEVAPSYPYLASYAVFLLSFATVRLLSSCTRRRETNHEQ